MPVSPEALGGAGTVELADGANDRGPGLVAAEDDAVGAQRKERAMEIELGKPVVSKDGDKVGTVDRLVLDADTKEIRQFLMKQGAILTEDRIVDMPLVARVDPDGTVHLDISTAMVNELPPFARERYIEPTDEQLEGIPIGWSGAATGAPLLLGPTYLGEGYDPRGPYMEPAPMNPPVVETETNLREDSIVIGEGTDVVGRDGDKVGTVDEVIYDEDGNVAGFVVKAGTLFHHDVRIPADWVEAVTSDTVRLRVTADEAERQAGGS